MARIKFIDMPVFVFSPHGCTIPLLFVSKKGWRGIPGKRKYISGVRT